MATVRSHLLPWAQPPPTDGLPCAAPVFALSQCLPMRARVLFSVCCSLYGSHLLNYEMTGSPAQESYLV